MLRATPRGLFSWKFVISDSDDRDIATIDIGWAREAGELRLAQKTYRLYRENLLSGDFILEDDGHELARAEKPSMFYRSFIVLHGGRRYELQASSPVMREFVLSEKEQPLGTVKPEGAFTRKAIVDLPEDIELPVRIFMIWLVLLLWKREQES